MSKSQGEFLSPKKLCRALHSALHLTLVQSIVDRSGLVLTVSRVHVPRPPTPSLHHLRTIHWSPPSSSSSESPAPEAGLQQIVV